MPKTIRIRPSYSSCAAERQAQLGYATPPKDEVVVEDATKKEIKDYLSSQHLQVRERARS